MIYIVDFIKKNVVKAFTFPYCRFNCTTGCRAKLFFARYLQDK
jgi:hypothetical protein